VTCGSHGHLPSESRTCLQLNQPAPPLERSRQMKHLLLTTIAAVVLVGCGKPSNPAADRALLKAAEFGNIEAVKQHLAAGADVNANNRFDSTPLDWAITSKQTEIADFLRKHGGKTKKELKAEGK